MLCIPAPAAPILRCPEDEAMSCMSIVYEVLSTYTSIIENNGEVPDQVIFFLLAPGPPSPSLLLMGTVANITKSISYISK